MCEIRCGVISKQVDFFELMEVVLTQRPVARNTMNNLNVREAAQALLLAELRRIGQSGRKDTIDLWAPYLPQYVDTVSSPGSTTEPSPPAPPPPEAQPIEAKVPEEEMDVTDDDIIAGKFTTSASLRK
ncbi:hypothetical protein KUCAC02_008811, partial [Chaenocephalus aceratus]